MAHPLIGKQAPEITLLDANSEPYDLKPGANGKPLVVFFYPAAGTYGCTREACDFRDAIATKDVFKRSECDVVGISKDPPQKQKTFVDENSLPYPVLSDTSGEARKLYSVERSLMGLSEGRVTFVVGRDGTVVDALSSNLNFGSHSKFAEKVLASIVAEGSKDAAAAK